MNSPSRATSALLLSAALIGTAAPAHANPTLAMDVDSGEVISHSEAFRPWAPASLTKMMTALVAFRAVEEGRATMDTPVVMSAYAAEKPASKMYWKPGTSVTLREAVIILMVKSGNDVATAVAETIGGTELEFVEMMNEEAARLGMTGTVFRNPSGLPDDAMVTNARDMAILGATIRRDFPQYDDLFGWEAIDTGLEKPILGYNLMLGRYEGADGMKTGFVCASGFNIVNTATRAMPDGAERTVLSVVLGAPSQERRAEISAELMERAFAPSASGPRLETLEPYGDTTSRTDLRSQICTEAARANRYDGRDVEGRMVLDTDLITPRTRAPITIAIEPQPPLPEPRVKPASLGGPAGDDVAYAYDTPVPMMRPDGAARTDEASLNATGGDEGAPSAGAGGVAVAANDAALRTGDEPAVRSGLAERAAPLSVGAVPAGER